MDPEVLRTLERIPLFDGTDLAALDCRRLGGLTNKNFRIDTPTDRYVLRLAGDGTGDYIDRDKEEVNARLASKAGVNAEVLHFDTSDGTMLCRYVDDSTTMSIEAFRDLGAVARAGRSFRMLHEGGEKFRGDFELFEQIDQYLGIVQKLGGSLPEGYADVQREAEAVRAALSNRDLPSAPCHCDPMVENCLDTGEKMWIIDFEYAGNNDPMWDVGDLSVEGNFTSDQDLVFLTAYFGGPPSADDHGRMVIYKAMCDLLWTLWGVVQDVNGNPAEDFRAYSQGRLDRCRALMASSDFPGHLEAVRQGG